MEKRNIKAKHRFKLAADFQGADHLHKAGASVEISCKVTSKDLGDFLLIIPDPVSLFLNKNESSIDSAKQIKNNIISQLKYKDVKEEKMYRYIQSAMAAYIFLVATIESFLNVSIPPDYVYEHEKKGKLDKEAIQKELNIYRKIDIVTETHKSKIKEDSIIWKSITDLIDIRNEIVHLKDLKPIKQGELFGKIFDTDFDSYSKSIEKFILSVRPKYFE